MFSSTLRWNCNLPIFSWKDLSNLFVCCCIKVKKYVLFYLFVYSSIYFIRFSMNMHLQSSSLCWSAWMDSNHRPHAYQACALTTWATGRYWVSVERSSSSSPLRDLSRWWRWGGSNPWPPACKAGALPAELHPHVRVCTSKIKQRCFQFPADSSDLGC